MKHHAQEEKNYDHLYYLVALVCGLIIGVVIDKGFTWIISCGIVGLLFASFFLNVLVKGREDI